MYFTLSSRHECSCNPVVQTPTSCSPTLILCHRAARTFKNSSVTRKTYRSFSKSHLADICAVIKVSHDLPQVALEISFAHTSCEKATVNSVLNLKSYVSHHFVARLPISYGFLSTVLQVLISKGWHLCLSLTNWY